MGLSLFLILLNPLNVAFELVNGEDLLGLWFCLILQWCFFDRFELKYFDPFLVLDEFSGESSFCFPS